MERKLDNELPVKGKKYKRITGGSTVYNKGYTYICEEDCKLKNIVWFNKDSFSQLFVEIIEEDKTKPVNYGDPWYKKIEEEVIAEMACNRTLLKPLTIRAFDLIGEDVENKINEKTGVKHDQNKLPLFTIIFKQFPLAIQAVARRALAGHNKYIETDSDWQNFARAGEQDPDRYKNAGMRHMLEEGEDKEEGMEGTTHEAAVVWNFLADLECKLRRDDKR